MGEKLLQLQSLDELRLGKKRAYLQVHVCTISTYIRKRNKFIVVFVV